MNTGSRILGNHGFFFRDGAAYTVPSSGNASRTAKPGATDTGWIDIGIVTAVKPERQSDAQEVWAPTPGVLRLYDIIRTKQKLSFTLNLEEVSPLSWELLFNTAALTSGSTQYNPCEGAQKKGWLKIQQYDQADALFNTLDVYVEVEVQNAEFGEGVVRLELKASVLHSTLNTGTLA